jgi:hypothetical protein
VLSVRRCIVAGVALVGLDTTLYDPMLDMTLALGLAPPRFAGVGGGALGRYFAMARSAPGIAALDMSKWRVVVTCITPLELKLLTTCSQVRYELPPSGAGAG